MVFTKSQTKNISRHELVEKLLKLLDVSSKLSTLIWIQFENIVTNFSKFYSNSKFAFVIIGAEAVAQRCSVKKVFLKISQNSQENTCARVSLFPVNFAKFLRTPFLTEHLR